jgi:phosphoribosylformylglycinamidine cyclo-ligase
VPWKAAAHITGGGLVENPPRFLSDELLSVELDPSTWEVPAIMQLIATADVTDEEMRRTFNMGLGMIIVVPPENADAALTALAPWKGRAVGTLVPRDGRAPSRYVGE